jgi:uncharacterized protein HemX
VTAPAASAAVAPAPIAPNPAPPVAADPLAPVAAAPAPAPAPARTISAEDDGLNPATGIAALLLALGIGAGGWAALRARRRHRWDERDEAYETEPAPAHAEPQAVAHSAAMPAYATADDLTGERVEAIEPTPHPTAAQHIGSEELALAAALAATPVALRSGRVPQTRHERDALLEEMVSAPPDAENPFTSRKARLRRARLILQRIEFDQTAETSQPFDWRTYKSSTSNPAPATPPRVTA